MQILIWLTSNHWTRGGVLHGGWEHLRGWEGRVCFTLFHLVCKFPLQFCLARALACVWVLLVLFLFGWVCCLLLSYGEIWSQSHANSSCWPTMSRTCPAMQEKKHYSLSESANNLAVAVSAFLSTERQDIFLRNPDFWIQCEPTFWVFQSVWITLYWSIVWPPLYHSCCLPQHIRQVLSLEFTGYALGTINSKRLAFNVLPAFPKACGIWCCNTQRPYQDRSWNRQQRSRFNILSSLLDRESGHGGAPTPLAHLHLSVWAERPLSHQLNFFSTNGEPSNSCNLLPRGIQKWFRSKSSRSVPVAVEEAPKWSTNPSLWRELGTCKVSFILLAKSRIPCLGSYFRHRRSGGLKRNTPRMQVGHYFLDSQSRRILHALPHSWWCSPSSNPSLHLLA